MTFYEIGLEVLTVIGLGALGGGLISFIFFGAYFFWLRRNIK